MQRTLCILVVVVASLAHAAEMPISSIVEERFKEDDSATFDRHTLEFSCAIGPSSPWGFAFAGIESNWREPLELEVSGSGGFETHDSFSMAGISIDYGTKDGWSEGSLFGLGLLQPTRAPHPPGWGVGVAETRFVRENLLDAKPQSQRVTLDPARFAPKDWDGRLWIGVLLHNVGGGKSLRVRIVNASSTAPATSDPLSLRRANQQAFLKNSLKTLVAAKARPEPVVKVVSAMAPYLKSPANIPPVDQRIAECTRLLTAIEKGEAVSAEAYLAAVENYFAWTTATPRANEMPHRLNALYRRWQDAGGYGKRMNCIIRTASNLQKIGLDDVTSGEVVASASSASAVQLSAARHEHEGFQIVLTPLVGATADVKLTASDLESENGTIAASNVTINPVGYLWITPDHLAPDPLLLGDPPALKPGENQPVWVDVYVPRDAKPGNYTGAITLSADSNSVSIPYALRVRDFEIPKQISLRSSFWMFRDQINRFYHLDEVSLDDYFAWIDMALAHRLNPIDVYEGHCQQLVNIQKMPTTRQSTDIGSAHPTPDFTKWDKYLDRMIAGGANTIHLGTTHHFGNFFHSSGKETSEAEHLQNVELAVKTMADHYKQRGVFNLHYLQLRDETSEPASLNVYRDIDEKFPDVKTLLTAPSPEARPLLRIPCPLTPSFETVWRDETHKKGNEYWWYVCVGPSDRRYANLFIEQEASQHRVLFWQTWSHGVDGLLYWGMNFWSWYESKWPNDSKGPTMRVPPKDSPNFVSIPTAPGDGCSMYPGPTPAQPLSSIRLEVMRDGEEDYEYFVILDRLIKQADADHKVTPVVANAKALHDKARVMVDSLTDYDKNAQPYLALRTQIGDSIEALSHELAK